MADSELSEFESETSVVSERVDDYEEEVNMNADDDEYVEELDQVKASKPKRSGSKRKPGRKPKRLANDDDDDDFERVHPARKRTKTARALQLDDQDDEDVRAPSADVEFDEEEPLETTEPVDEEELSDTTRPTSILADEEDETRETTGDSLKRATKSKMLQELLGDSNRRSLTEEQAQLRRAENARKRKNLSEKRLEEEKQETVNKLLRRRAGKSRSHIPKEDEPQLPINDPTVFTKPRRPYDSTGMTRTLRKLEQDLYCTVADRQHEPATT
ncbi:hypothetical protein HG537_0C00490 [Torulaspora globosa]|uniref:INO80 complex subunit B-like conserved region domain-containing protein n=1 Tax=Torulaspora globosa TaxID=48254 RepID=A0A7H9HSS2_9SACH|nr:hypothetical protein HG537_0C00490 [Torulaspora sp. CBS 2947]